MLYCNTAGTDSLALFTGVNDAEYTTNGSVKISISEDATVATHVPGTVLDGYSSFLLGFLFERVGSCDAVAGFTRSQQCVCVLHEHA
jgi:hypothetical protein